MQASSPTALGLFFVAINASALLLPVFAHAQPRLDVPYVSTPQAVVDRMLAMAKVGPDDVVYDLGCGDGRIVITAARVHGARGVGLDLDPRRIEEANSNLKAAGLEGRVKFLQADIFHSNFSEASVVMLYLLPEVNVALRPQLWRQLKVGTRVVSHAFEMGPDWPAEASDTVDGQIIHMWTITEKVKQMVR